MQKKKNILFFIEYNVLSRVKQLAQCGGVNMKIFDFFFFVDKRLARVVPKVA